ncbi:MAG: hypothetical protein RI883_1509 [Bacteroidota bacterium]|jgi:hypothetical protein
MRKFSINREKKNLEPSDEQIKRHKDFSRIHHNYERLTKRGKHPIFKDPKLYLLIVLLGIIMLLVFLEK